MESLAKAISSGSLRGARGNSGVILSQLLRGFTRSVKNSKELDAIDIAAAMEKGVELVREGEEACWVQTEPVALAIALQNLVTNALNFSPAGSEVKVVIGVNCLSVEDQGPGIDEAEMERLFERFYSRDNANGAGLGLAIVEMIVGKIGSALTLHNLAQGGLRARLSFTACAQAPAGIPHR